MDCQTAKENIQLYLDDMLDNAEKERLFLHVQTCARCRKELEDAAAIKKALSGLGEVQPPEGLALGAIKKAKKREFPVFVYASAGVAAAVVLGVILTSGFLSAGRNADTNSAFEATEEQAIAFSAEDESVKAESDTEEEACMDEAASDDVALGMAEESVEESAESGDSLQSGSYAACRFTVPPEQSDGFRKTLDSFIEDNGIAAEYIETEDTSVVSFVIDDAVLSEFETIVADMPYEGELYTGCIVEFTFIK
ncbi:MAG: zf-HC2 domain-containing protein [Eubacteriales bacterium]|nr:zf-HC2 domain-containing protein [Eubacteriales bacterium]